jgi:hypothetical protein
MNKSKPSYYSEITINMYVFSQKTIFYYFSFNWRNVVAWENTKFSVQNTSLLMIENYPRTVH